VSEGTATSAAGRLLVLVLAMGAAGWASYTLYERARADAAPAPSPVPKDEIAPYVDKAQAHLVAGRLDEADVELTKASGLDEEDERVLEGLALVEVLRAEHVWWQTELRSESRKEAVERLDHDVDMARQAIAVAMRHARSPDVKTRLRLYERRLNTFVVVAFARIGNHQRAEGALEARLADHPQRKLIAAYVAREDGEDGKGGDEDGGEDDESEERGGVLEEEDAVPPRPTQPAGGPGAHQEGHFEFDSEPQHIPKTKGELELPATVD